MTKKKKHQIEELAHLLAGEAPCRWDQRSEQNREMWRLKARTMLKILKD